MGRTKIEVDLLTGEQKVVPYTAEEEMAADAAYQAELDARSAPPPVEDYQNAIQALVDEAAISRRYKSGDAMATYVASTVGDWASEAQAFVAWRDNVWQYAYAELAKVQGGERVQPTVADFLSELPEIVWP